MKVKKYDDGKAPVQLLPARPLVEIARVLAFGAGKYGKYNWAKGMEWSRLLGSLHRHVLAWHEGEDFDKESGISHLAHAGCCILFLLAYQLYGLGQDDRWKPGLVLGVPEDGVDGAGGVVCAGEDELIAGGESAPVSLYE